MAELWLNAVRDKIRNKVVYRSDILTVVVGRFNLFSDQIPRHEIIHSTPATSRASARALGLKQFHFY